MANAIGLGTFFPTGPSHVAPPVEAPSPPVELAPDPRAEAAVATLERACALLAQHPAGLTAVQLRADLAEDPAVLARGLAEGIRTKRLRRLGARRSMRYVAQS